MRRYSVESRTRKYIKENIYLLENTKNNSSYRTRCCKNCFQKSRFIKQLYFSEKKVADAVTKSNNDKFVKEEPVEEILILPEKRNEMLNKLRKVL